MEIEIELYETASGHCPYEPLVCSLFVPPHSVVVIFPLCEDMQFIKSDLLMRYPWISAAV